jgi:predicted nuclease of predicted toxin-antitoxin system
MDWGLLEHNEKKVFKIEVGNLSKEEVETLVRKLMKQYNRDYFMEERRNKLDKIVNKMSKNLDSK